MRLSLSKCSYVVIKLITSESYIVLLWETSQKVMYDTPLIRVWEIYDPDDVNIMKVNVICGNII